MIRNYIKMKKAEWKIKATIYGAVAYTLENSTEVIDMLKKLFVAVKDVPAEDLQKEFVGALAKIIHEENQKSE
ncbi:MAG: hypothetical protein NC489_21145 [Ruminococcus flavefaciens]|nr:hypothetical protein [Ruminococcus flavefaciens]